LTTPGDARLSGSAQARARCRGRYAEARRDLALDTNGPEERGIENIDECPENRSEAFYEGCLTYVDDPERGADFDDDGKLILVPRRTTG